MRTGLAAPATSRCPLALALESDRLADDYGTLQVQRYLCSGIGSMVSEQYVSRYLSADLTIGERRRLPSVQLTSSITVQVVTAFRSGRVSFLPTIAGFPVSRYLNS